jgi:hypothetical protein
VHSFRKAPDRVWRPLGLHSVHENGGYTVAQDEASSVVYGMPCRAVELGGVDASLPLDRIAAEIVRVTADVKRGGVGPSALTAVKG